MQSLKDQTRTVWRSRLKSALRTVVACSIVGITTMYSPGPVRHLLAYPAFSYVTTIMIVSDATAGNTFRGFWHVVYASVQVMLSSVLSLWLVHPARFTPGMAAAAVALTSFVVAIPESTHIMSKRLAFGQIVIVYVGTAIQGAATHIVMHPIHVALSTGLGAVASILALLLPYPRLACSEVRKTCRMYVENAAERLNFYLDAFTSGDKVAATELISQAAVSSRTGGKLLQNMKDNQDGMLWERPDIRFRRPNYAQFAERFQEVELPLRGMELALNSCPSFPIPAVDEELGNILPHRKTLIGQKMEQAKCFAPFGAMTAPETKDDSTEKSRRALWTTPRSLEDLPALFFLFCMVILQGDLPTAPARNPSPTDDKKPRSSLRHWVVNLKPSNESLVFALKCSISLGLAVLLGLMYNKENGYWSGLTIAISFVMERQPTFTVANARAQGTAMGSVYGIICFFIFERFMGLRLLALLPWVVFTSFLRHSKMYGQAGGISAVIGALLILGRTNYGAPDEFAIARVTEAVIGLICFVAVEILFEPARAGTLARIELSESCREVRECVKGIVPCHNEKDVSGSAFREFWKKLNHLKSRVSGYETYTREAEVEPNFWFCPFPASSYLSLLDSFSRTIDLLQFLAFQMVTLKQQCHNAGLPWKDVSDPLKADLEIFADRVGSTFDCLKKVTSIKSISEIDKELQKKTTNLQDIEMGKSAKPTLPPPSCIAEEEAEKISNSFLHQLSGVTERIHAHECEDEVRSQMVLCLGGFVFCMDKLMRETTAMEDTVKELIKRQNPSCNVNLCEISSKIDAARS